MDHQTPPIDAREVKRADQLERGDIVVDEFSPGDFLYREVRHVEPLDEDPGRVLIVFRGGETENLRGAGEVDLAGHDEHEKHLEKIREQAKRTRMLAGLHRLIALIDEGLPLPSAIGIDLRLLSTAEDVHRWATALGVDAADRETEHGHSVAIRRHSLADGPSRSLPDVEVDVWHLGRKRYADGHTGTSECCTSGCPAVES